MCLALLDGRAWTAGELAAHARVAPSTATEHLHRLIDGGLLVERRQGRHRYVQLAGPSVAHLLEDLSARIEPRPASARGLRAVTARAALQRRPYLLRPPRRTARRRGDRRDDRGGAAGPDRRLRPHRGRPGLADRHTRAEPSGTAVRQTGPSHGDVSTGRSGASTSPGWPGRSCTRRSSAMVGWHESAPAAQCGSPRTERPRCGISWACPASIDGYARRPTIATGRRQRRS